VDAGRVAQTVDPSEVPYEDLFSGLDAYRPSSPCSRLLEWIHRDSHNVVMFTHKDNGTRWEEYGGIRADRLRELFTDQNFLREIDRDSYCTPLSYEDRIDRKPPSNYRNTSPMLRFVSRKGENLAAMPCVWVDLDFYKLGLRRGDAWGGIVNLVDEGAFPAPSVYVSSGQGMYCVWLIVDSETGRAPVNTAENFSAWDGCMKRIHELTSHVGSDKQGQLQSQVLRIPGTLNTRANARVEFYCKLDEQGFLQRYRLHDLATQLNVRHHDRYEAWVLAQQGAKVDETVRRRSVDPALSARGRLGFRAIWLRRYDQIRRLLEIRARRGVLVPVGNRRNVARLYAISLMRSGLATAVAEERAKYGLSTDEIPDPRDYVKHMTRQIVSAAFARGDKDSAFNVDRDVFSRGWDVAKHRFKDVTISEVFKPTEEESRLCGMPTVGEAQRKGEERRSRLTRPQKERKAQDAILAVLATTPNATAALVAQVCTEVHGVRMSERTARARLSNLRRYGVLTSRPINTPCFPTPVDN
jgi:hypothetical protein